METDTKLDPNATIDEMVGLAGKIQIGDGDDNTAFRLSSLTGDLDHYLRTTEATNLPTRWQRLADGSPEQIETVREILIELRDRCLGKDGAEFDAEGAVILSHAIRWLSFKAEGKPYVAASD